MYSRFDRGPRPRLGDILPEARSDRNANNRGHNMSSRFDVNLRAPRPPLVDRILPSNSSRCASNRGQIMFSRLDPRLIQARPPAGARILPINSNDLNLDAHSPNHSGLCQLVNSYGHSNVRLGEDGTVERLSHIPLDNHEQLHLATGREYVNWITLDLSQKQFIVNRQDATHVHILRTNHCTGHIEALQAAIGFQSGQDWFTVTNCSLSGTPCKPGDSNALVVVDVNSHQSAILGYVSAVTKNKYLRCYYSTSTSEFTFVGDKPIFLYGIYKHETTRSLDDYAQYHITDGSQISRPDNCGVYHAESGKQQKTKDIPWKSGPKPKVWVASGQHNYNLIGQNLGGLHHLSVAGDIVFLEFQNFCGDQDAGIVPTDIRGMIPTLVCRKGQYIKYTDTAANPPNARDKIVDARTEIQISGGKIVLEINVDDPLPGTQGPPFPHIGFTMQDTRSNQYVVGHILVPWVNAARPTRKI